MLNFNSHFQTNVLRSEDHFVVVCYHHSLDRLPEFNIVSKQFTFAMNKTWDIVNIGL